MFKRYPQLQSGYLSPSEDMVKKPDTPPVTPVSTLLNRTPTRTQQDLFFVPALDRHVNVIIQDPIKLRDFGYQQQVLVDIAKAFGKMPFSSFVILQSENPGISSMHVEFLRETIELAMGVRETRSISLTTWASVISAANESVGSFDALGLVNEFRDWGFPSLPLHSFLTKWIRAGGYTDLLLSMQVIFGRRSIHGIQGGTY